jgi:hypothetical protein
MFLCRLFPWQAVRIGSIHFFGMLWQRAEGKRQEAEGRRQKAEGKGQKEEGRGQEAEGRRSPDRVMVEFDYSLDFKTIDFRQQPELYRIGRGEQGVLLVEPYKSEILPHWRFKTPDIARQSAAAIYQMFLDYKSQADFVGMDMARKFLQMGYTRSRRYANHKSGRKYAKDAKNKDSKTVLPRDEDPVKAESAKIFYEMWQLAKTDPEYLELADRHRQLYEQE